MWIAPHGFGDDAFLMHEDRRMNQAVEFFQALGSVPDQGTQFGAVNMVVLIQDIVTELLHDGIIGLATGREDLVAELIGFNQHAPEIGKGMSDEGFAARQSSGESYAEHRRCSAARTVLAISIAIVSGPTPPGTGVNAPATSLTSSGFTSPTNLPSGLRFMPTSMTVAPGRM